MPYLHDLSDLTLILQPFQFQVCCANQLVTSKKGSGKARSSRGLAWAERAGMGTGCIQCKQAVVWGAAGTGLPFLPSYLPCGIDSSYLPFVEDLKFDSFALDHSLKAPVISIDV